MDWSLSQLPDDHPTPSIIVSKEIALANIAAMQQYCDSHGLKLRPHTKTHKSKWAAQEQIRQGATGLTVAKVGEAEVMAEVSDDIFIAYPAIGAARLKRIGELAKRVSLRVAADSKFAIDQLQEIAKSQDVSIGVVIDIDVGFHRTGVLDSNQAIELCKYAASQSHLTFEGLMCFPGHILPQSGEDVWSSYEVALKEIVESNRSQGVTGGEVSGGSTPTAFQSHRNGALTEIRPGTYIYNDLNEVRLGVCSLDQVAARIVATVISAPEANKIVVDAGSKTLSSDRNAADANCGWGFLPDYPNAKVVRLSEEHGEIILSTEDLRDREPPHVGDRLWIIPNHICVCVNLQNQFYLFDGESYKSLPVDARGLLN